MKRRDLSRSGEQRMIRGFHFIFSAYRFWLPNDPRGSWSEVVRQYELLAFGPATKVATTRSVAVRSHDVERRLAAKAALRHPPVRFTGEQARCIASGFREAVREHHYSVHALVILPDHAHLVMTWHHLHADRIAAHLKAKATHALAAAGLHPMPEMRGRRPSPWARGHWCPFIDSAERMRAAIRYVQQNPVKAGLPPQRWSFVRPYVEQRDKSRRFI